MSASAKRWAVRARDELMEILGAVCACCGIAENLTFDTIRPTGDKHHKGSTDQRMIHYRYQHFEHANVQVLCHRCNARKGDSETDYRKENLELAGMLTEGLPF